MELLDNLQALVVDDHRQMRMLVRSVLRAAGLPRISEAESAEEALELIARVPFDLLIIDWQMAPMDGIELTHNIRRLKRQTNFKVPIIMLTAHTEFSRVKAARDAGVHGMVRKPISTHLLLERVSAALTDRRAFVSTDAYCGPDRRHALAANAYEGPFRRQGDNRRAAAVLDLDDLPQAYEARA